MFNQEELQNELRKEYPIFIGEGNIGRIYVNESKNKILKLPKYNLYFKDNSLLEKLVLIDHDNFSFPIDLIYKDIDNSNRIVGYTARFSKGESIEDMNKEILFDDFVKSVENGFKNILLMYEKGIIPYDLYLQNMLYEEKNIYFIDTDSYLIGDNKYYFEKTLDTYFKEIFNFLNNSLTITDIYEGDINNPRTKLIQDFWFNKISLLEYLTKFKELYFDIHKSELITINDFMNDSKQYVRKSK
ncbi:MAG: hypothetical protein R3Y13_02855 [bacterium]